MSDWKRIHQPDRDWAPSGLPGWLKLAPSWAARMIPETRLPLEVGELLLDPLWFDETIPRGDGQPVMVVPGFGFGDPAATPMYAVLKRFGYHTVRSEIWANIHCSDTTVDAMAKVAEAAVDANAGQRISVVGHSRGGMLARGLAARRPDLIARAISLGAPLNDESAYYEIPRPLVSALRTLDRIDHKATEKDCFTPQCQCPYMLAAHRPIPKDVELVSVYSKQDGVVDWRSCVVPYGRNVEVHCSHMGLGSAPEAVRVVLDSLAQPLPERGVAYESDAK